MIYIAEHTAAFGLFAVFLWLPGYALERLAVERGWLGISPELRLPARFSLGIGAWIVALFAMASLGLLHRPMLLAVAGIAAVAALWTRLGLSSAQDQPSTEQPRWWSIRSMLAGGDLATMLAGGDLAKRLAGSALATILAPLYFLALSPTVSWDANAYHLTLPKLFLAHDGFHVVPLNVYSYWPLNIQLIYAAAMAFSDFVVAKLIHFGFGVLTLVTLYYGCKTFHRPATGWLAMPLLLANGVFAYELRVAYVDLAHAFFFLAGFLFMIAALDRKQPDALWLAGICCGIAAGIKITGIVSAAVIGAVYLVNIFRSRGGGRLPWRPFLVRFVVPVLVLWSPWIIRLAWTTGNPVYPFFYDTFGGPDWSTHLSEQLRTWQGSIGMGRASIDYVLLPLRVILAGGVGYERFDGAIGGFWIVLLPLALWNARRNSLTRCCLGVAGLTFVFWAVSSQQMRFLIPILPLLAMAGAIAIVELLERLSSPSWQRAGKGLVFAAMLAFFVATQARILSAGTRTFGIYLKAKGDLTASAIPPVQTFINQNLALDARLLFLNTNQAFFCDRELIADSFFEASQIAEWLAPANSIQQLRELLGERGITHILIEHRPRPIAYPRALGELLQDPSRAERLYHSADGRFSVFAIR